MTRFMIYSLALGALAVVASATPASAQVVFGIEGSANAIASNGLGGASVTVGGTVLDLKAGVGAPVVKGPAGVLAYADLINPAPLPGRIEPGFVGGLIAAGGSTTPAGVVTVGTFSIQPGIASLTGVVTANTLGAVGGSLVVNGTPCVLNADPRLPIGRVMNDLGLPINTAAILPGAAALVSGYPATDGTGMFYCYSIEVIGVAPAAPGLAVGIERVTNNGGVINVRGGVAGLPLTLARNAVVTVSIFAPGATPTAAPVLVGTVNGTAGVLAGTRVFTFKSAKALAVVPKTVYAQVTVGAGAAAVTVKSAIVPVQ